jgi:metal-responsive CopG/Arc/MetJ family transcriptional regulator
MVLRREYISRMKVKTSITLSEDVNKRLDRATRRGENRSQAIERLLRERLQAEARKATDSRDRALIDEHAAELNTEAEDVLTYQAEL